MPYLTPGQNEFEQVVNRWNKPRSAQLDKTVNAVKKYVKMATADHLRGIGLFYVGWRNQQPTEFEERALPLQNAFEKELLQAYRRFNIGIDADLAAASAGTGHGDRYGPCSRHQSMDQPEARSQTRVGGRRCWGQHCPGCDRSWLPGGCNWRCRGRIGNRHRFNRDLRRFNSNDISPCRKVCVEDK